MDRAIITVRATTLTVTVTTHRVTTGVLPDTCITPILAGITVIGGIIVGITIKISKSLRRMKDPARISRVFVFLHALPHRRPDMKNLIPGRPSHRDNA